MSSAMTVTSGIERVAERVLEDHLAAGHALGSRGADVVGVSTSSIDARSKRLQRR